jgi:hypothetical protein
MDDHNDDTLFWHYFPDTRVYMSALFPKFCNPLGNIASAICRNVSVRLNTSSGLSFAGHSIYGVGLLTCVEWGI